MTTHHRGGSARWLACFLVLAPGLASAQAILHPNQVQVSLVFTNTNPEIRALLDAPFLSGEYSWSLDAGSVAPTGGLSASSYTSEPTRGSTAGEITVESGLEGIAYEIEVAGYKGGSSRLFYKSRRLRTDPIRYEPAPDGEAHFEECAGLLRLRLLDAAGSPVLATGGTIEARLREPGDGRSPRASCGSDRAGIDER